MKVEKRRRLGLRKGQSVAELAIMGSLVLFAFATLLTYGQRFEAQQQAKQEAFRRALNKAFQQNSAVSYNLKKDVRFLNLFGGYGEGQASTVGASASVMWVKGAPGPRGTKGETSYAFYQINDQTIELPKYKKEVIGYSGDEAEVKVPVGIWKEEGRKDTYYNSTSRKQEDSSAITNTQIADLQENVTTTLFYRFDKKKTDARDDPDDNAPEYVYGGDSYTYDGSTHTVLWGNAATQWAIYNSTTNRIDYNTTAVGNTIHKERTWRTGN